MAVWSFISLCVVFLVKLNMQVLYFKRDLIMIINFQVVVNLSQEITDDWEV